MEREGYLTSTDENVYLMFAKHFVYNAGALASYMIYTIRRQQIMKTNENKITQSKKYYVIPPPLERKLFIE